MKCLEKSLAHSKVCIRPPIRVWPYRWPWNVSHTAGHFAEREPGNEAFLMARQGKHGSLLWLGICELYPNLVLPPCHHLLWDWTFWNSLVSGHLLLIHHWPWRCEVCHQWGRYSGGTRGCQDPHHHVRWGALRLISLLSDTERRHC